MLPCSGERNRDLLTEGPEKRRFEAVLRDETCLENQLDSEHTHRSSFLLIVLYTCFTRKHWVQDGNQPRKQHTIPRFLHIRCADSRSPWVRRNHDDFGVLVGLRTPRLPFLA